MLRDLKIYCFEVRLLIFQLENVTGWGNDEGVKLRAYEITYSVTEEWLIGSFAWAGFDQSVSWRFCRCVDPSKS